MSAAPTDPALGPSDAPDISPPVVAADNTNNNNPKERHSLTLDQRRALRRWANSQTIRPSHKSCIDWFLSQYGQQISQSTVSHSLSPKYSRLDGDNPQLSGSRLRFGNWPDVEKLVLLWYQQVQASGRQPTNEELGDKAKSIFNQLPRYKEETSPEFSPGWIHRFKKRYGLLIRRQRRHGEGAINPADDIEYLAECVPRFMAIASDTSPAAIREQVLRVVGVESSLNTCALVRDEILRRLSAQLPSALAPIEPAIPAAAPQQPDQQQQQQQQQHLYSDDDPEVVLQNALRQLQQEEQAAEEQAAAVREERERAERVGVPQHQQHQHQQHQQPSSGLPAPGARSTSDPRYATPGQDMTPDLTLTPIHAEVPIATHDRPLRCPFCVNQRMLRSIKEAVEHMSNHVVV